jgi:hypothetical protein
VYQNRFNTVTAQENTSVIRNKGGRAEMVWKEWCDGMAEMLEDAERGGEMVAV